MNGIVLGREREREKKRRHSKKSKRISLHASYNCNKSAVRIYFYFFLCYAFDDSNAEKKIKTDPKMNMERLFNNVTKCTHAY